MTAVTEYGRYLIEEEGRGQFYITTLEFHGPPGKILARVGSRIRVLPPLSVGVGISLAWTLAGEQLSQHHENRIKELLP